MRELIAALMEIQAMIYGDPNQPIKNCQSIINSLLQAIDEGDVGLPVNLNTIGKRKV